MPIWPKQESQAMNSFYGDPDSNKDLTADAKWEATNIVDLVPPYTLYYPQEVNKVVIKRQTVFKRLRVHKVCKDSLEKILSAVPKEFTAAEIDAFELDICGGVYNFRLKRGGTSLSVHSWGAAIDLSHLINAWKKKWRPEVGMMPVRMVKIFGDEGWTFGGTWSTPDAMHFQAADL